MIDTYELSRFITAQENDYQIALAEIRSGKKRSHWMWYIFPQLASLGKTETARHYGITDIHEAALYMKHPILGPRLIEISEALIDLEGSDPYQIFGHPDDLKLRSCMTLFASLKLADPVFELVLHKFYKGLKDELTLSLIST